MNALRQKYFKLLSILIVMLISLILLSISLYSDNHHLPQQEVQVGNINSQRKVVETFNEENAKLFFNLLSKLSVVLNKTNHVMKLEVQNEENTQSYIVDGKLQFGNINSHRKQVETFNEETAKLFLNLLSKFSVFLNKTNHVIKLEVQNDENTQSYNVDGKLQKISGTDKSEILTNQMRSIAEKERNDQSYGEVRTLEFQARKNKNGYLEMNIDTPTYNLQVSSNISFSFKSTLTPHDKMMLMDTASYLVSVCEDLNITCMMYGGTLLGSWRHHDIVPWDDDIDIILNINEKDELYSALTKDNRQFHAVSAGPRLKLFSINGSRTSTYPWLWPYVDISFYYENATHIWDSSIESNMYKYRKSITFPPHLRPLGELLMYAPRDTFAHLDTYFKGKKCQTYHYSHKREKVRKEKVISIPCETLKNDIGFVHRSNNSVNGITEVMMLGTTVIHTMNIDEPKYAITDPYTLKLM